MMDQNFFKSHAKDPRALMGLPVAGGMSPDQWQMLAQYLQENGNTIPLPHAVMGARRGYTSENTIRVEYSLYVVNGTFPQAHAPNSASKAQLLVPRNENRCSLIICNNSNTIFMTFGPLDPFVNGRNCITMSLNDKYIEDDGVVPINEVNVCAGFFVDPITVVAFEGTAVLNQDHDQ